MKATILCLVVTLWTLPAVAELDLGNVGEGSGEKRQQLDALQGKPAPPLQVSNWLNGESTDLKALKGKIVVLDFWATWCGPCIKSIPHNNELAAKYEPKGVVFIGVCHPRGKEKMEKVVEEKGLKYRTVTDPDGATIKAYRVNSYPDYYLIDRKGILRVADCQNGKVEEVIEALLAAP